MAFRVVLVGPENTGKSTVFRALSLGKDEPHVEEKYRPTIGPPKTHTLPKSGDSDSDVTLLDAGGQWRHRSYAISTFPTVAGAMVVYDVSRRESFQAMLEDEWLRHIKSAAPSATIFLVGNKVDLGDDLRQVPTEEGAKYAKDNDLAGFLEISAKDRSSVVALLDQMKATLKQDK